jgi:hypothetical protein
MDKEELKKNQDSSQYGNINLLQQAQQQLQIALQNPIWQHQPEEDLPFELPPCMQPHAQSKEEKNKRSPSPKP